MLIKDVSHSVFILLLLVNALLFLPQALRILRKKTADEISLFTYIGFWIIQFIFVIFALNNDNYWLVFAYLIGMVACGLVIALVFRFRKRKTHIMGLGFEDVLKQLPGHIYWKDINGTFVGSNTHNWQDFGLSSLEDYVGKNDYDILPKEQAEVIRATDYEVMKQRQSIIIEETGNLKNGETALFLSWKSPIFAKNNEVIGVGGVSLDITQARQHEMNRLCLLENIIALMPAHVYWLDREGRYLGCNDEQAKSAGLNSRHEIIGKRNVDLPWNYNAKLLPDALDKINSDVMATGEAMAVEEPAVLRDGTRAVFLSYKVPMKDDKNKVIGMVGISIDITDRKKMEEELKVAKEAAELADKAKTEFLYNMRHDFRTPFSGLLGIAEVLEVQETDAQKKEYLGYIKDSAAVLLNQLNEILDFLKNEDGKLPVVEKPFNLKNLLDNLQKIMLPPAQQKHLKLVLTVADDVPLEVVGDAIRTDRILSNLVANAIKFTQKGHVLINVAIAKRTPAMAVIEFKVEDTGIGIPKQQQDSIFEKMTRLTSSYQGLYTGKGFGLYITRKFLEEMDGEIHLISEEGRGTIFTVLIPYRLPLLTRTQAE